MLVVRTGVVDESLPSRERGLKLDRTPLLVSRKQVAPFTGAWIEIWRNRRYAACVPSLPSRERGLKYACACSGQAYAHVAPFTGAWIEMAAPGL